ncbi:MAG: hypothetical protein ACREPU_13970, partial [Rhodanobacteraceae bacterium]
MNFDHKKRRARREVSLVEMHPVLPGGNTLGVIFSLMVAETRLLHEHRFKLTSRGICGWDVNLWRHGMAQLLRSFHGRGSPRTQKGLMGYVLGWLLGIPIPILIIVALLRS